MKLKQKKRKWNFKMIYNKKDNYCSYSPDQLFGVRFNFSCFLHDRQYRNEVVRRKTRLEADRHLKFIIYQTYKKAGKRIIGFFVSWFYYVAVRLFAGKCWVK